MTILVRPMEKNDASAWDVYVASHPDGTFCHRAGWNTAVEEGAGQKSVYLLAEREGRIVGVLPLTKRKSLLFGDALISSMFAVYGGPLADDADIYGALDETAWALASKHHIPSLEYRNVRATGHDPTRWTIDRGAATFRKNLKTTAEEILMDIPRKQRAVVRKSLKAGLRCAWDKDVDVFYRLYAESVRNLGTPVFPKQLFNEFLTVFGDDTEIQIIYAPDGEAIAGLMSFYHQEWVLPYYAGGTPRARQFGAHDFMYYKLMVRATELGKTGFDFGRSKIDSGPYKFKKNWGFEPTTLEYQTRLAEGASKNDLNPAAKKYSLLVTLWKKLPLAVANILGPPISRHLG